MSTEPKRIRANDDVSLDQVLEQADGQPVEIERRGKIYDLYARPYTAENVYASVKTIDGRSGAQVSNDEIEEAIRLAKEENVQRVLDGLRDTS